MLIFRALLTVLIPAGCSSISIPEVISPSLYSKAPIHPTAICNGETHLDILTFENDRPCRLDSYQRISNFNGNIAYVESTSGEKIIFLCSEGPHQRHEWSGIYSYNELYNKRSYLKHECPDHPTRTGECRVNAGDSSSTVTLKPLISEVRIEAISCDFSGTPYAGESISGLKAYLINVNHSCPLAFSTPEKPIQIFNHGKLSDNDIKTMVEPNLLYAEITPYLGTNTLRPECRFICMPNFGTEGSPGNPPTRLVLEGKIKGHTYYWPINIGYEHDTNMFVVERNNRYTYDIHIRSKGTTDPDIPINIKSAEIKLNIEPWVEKKKYGIEF